MVTYRTRYTLTACTLTLFCVIGTNAFAQATNPAQQAAVSSPADDVIPQAQLLHPADVAQILRSPNGEKPLILQVGSHIFYAEAHIPGSEYVGAAGQDSGLRALRGRVKGLARDRFVIIYCGCCPWNKCPNIHPAYKELISRGFTNVKVLYLANNFGTDWVAQVYPVAKGR